MPGLDFEAYGVNIRGTVEKSLEVSPYQILFPLGGADYLDQVTPICVSS